jgi:uncharacterized protein (TIGR02646 family)
MIRVARPAQPPNRLIKFGVRALARICASFDADSRAYTAGTKMLEFKSSIYGHSSVKSSLQRAQNDKCCYCEGIFHGHAAGDVEHFRPKAYFQQDAASPKSYPGYYWLVYDWSNLLFSCQICNRSHKRNLFPIIDPTARAYSRNQNISLEAPLIIDPGGQDDPYQHIQFHEEMPRGITDRGRATISVLKLDRISLNETRRERLDKVRALQKAVALLSGDTRPEAINTLADARAALQQAALPSAEFSAMMRDYLTPRAMP